MKSSAARGWALISLRSWSSAARQSTRRAVSEGLRNSSAASGEAMRSESDARSCETKRKPFPTTVSPPGGTCCARSGPVSPWRARSRNRLRSSPRFGCRRRCAAARWCARRWTKSRACRTRRRSGPWSRAGLDHFERHPPRQRDRHHIDVVRRQFDRHALLKIGRGVADDVFGHLDLVIGFRVHEVETVTVFIEIGEVALFDRGLLDLVGGLVALGDLYPVRDSAHLDLADRGALAGMDVLGGHDDI